MTVILIVLGGTPCRQEECLLVPVWTFSRVPEIVRSHVPRDAYVWGHQQLLADCKDTGRKSVPGPRLLISRVIALVISAECQIWSSWKRQARMCALAAFIVVRTL